MRKNQPRNHREAVRRLIEALEVPPCRCPLVRIHTRECNRTHIRKKRGDGSPHCPEPRNGEIGQCRCNRRCDCRIDLSQPPCPHARGAAHNMSLERWQAFLEANAPDEYYTPDPPNKPAACASRENRIAILEQRASLKNDQEQHLSGLWNSEDRFTHDDLAQVNVKESGGKGFSLGEVRAS